MFKYFSKQWGVSFPFMRVYIIILPHICDSLLHIVYIRKCWSWANQVFIPLCRRNTPNRKRGRAVCAVAVGDPRCTSRHLSLSYHLNLVLARAPLVVEEVTVYGYLIQSAILPDYRYHLYGQVGCSYFGLSSQVISQINAFKMLKSIISFTPPSGRRRCTNLISLRWLFLSFLTFAIDAPTGGIMHFLFVITTSNDFLKLTYLSLHW